MIETINDVDVHYLLYGNSKKDTLVLLHGWGQNTDMMKPLAEPFSKNYQIVLIDLPGYGKSSEPKQVWTVFDYADCIHQLLKRNKIKNPILLGHSFGGKISLVYASKYEVQKLILFGSPYCPEMVKLSMKTKLLKQLKKIKVLSRFEEFAKQHIGSVDYKQATPMMREILVETVNLDVKECAEAIGCPTLIVWGQLDEAVPINRAHELELLISNAGLVIYEGATHYAYLEQLNRTIRVLHHFLEDKE